MKKIHIFLALVIIVITGSANAQTRTIVVQNGNTISFFTDIDAAFAATNDGDTIYLPGGIWTPGSGELFINNFVHIFGAGHNPDSTTATNACHIQGDLSFQYSACSNSTMTGIYVSGYVHDDNGDVEPLQNITISRCNIGGIYFQQGSSTNWSLFENIIRGVIYANNTSNHLFTNNIFEAGFSSFPFNNSSFNNNIFLFNYNGSYYMVSASSSMFENNIFASSSNTLYNVATSTLNNNLYVEDITFPYGTNINNDTNIVNTPLTSIFVNPPTDHTFYYTSDYHLLYPSGPGVGTGTPQGTDIGIYSGMFPWKDGSLPTNPHIISKNISAVTRTPDGALHINIKAESQNH